MLENAEYHYAVVGIERELLRNLRKLKVSDTQKPKNYSRKNRKVHNALHNDFERKVELLNRKYGLQA